MPTNVLQFAPSRDFVSGLLAREPTRDGLPRIDHYCKRPTYDLQFRFCSARYHPDAKLLVHGASIEPTAFVPTNRQLSALNRLPRNLRQLLTDFPFDSDSDLVSYLALLLQMLLNLHFARTGKPVGVINGNQPGVGKTLLMSVAGILADGTPPRLIPYTSNEEELRKHSTALLRKGDQTILALDNAKPATGNSIGGAYLESMTTATTYSDRVLGGSAIFERPNDFTTMVTVNHGRVTTDIASRCVPINLSVEGRASQRVYATSDLNAWCQLNRERLLAELFGIVEFWKDEGRPQSQKNHRFRYWAATIGGILAVAGFPEFLSNHDASVQELDDSAQELTALSAEARQRGAPFYRPFGSEGQVGAPAGSWVQLFEFLRIREPELAAATTSRAKATRVGQFLGANVNSEVSDEFSGSPHSCILRSRSASGNQTLYWFESVSSVGEQPDPIVCSPDQEPQIDNTPVCPGGNNLTWE